MRDQDTPKHVDVRQALAGGSTRRRFLTRFGGLGRVCFR
jgi:hypothetical protein